MSDADELVRKYIILHYRKCKQPAHLATCPDVIVENAEANFASFYDTGVDGYEFIATLRCPHEAEDYVYGELGDLPDILADLEQDRF